MLRSQCFLVIGAPRSGTSCVAGILHHLGVFMGERLLPPNRMNPTGFFHDLDFEAAFSEPDSLKPLIEKRSNMERWGLKSHRAAQFIKMFPSPRLILLRRLTKHSKASWRRFRGAEEVIDREVIENKLLVEASGCEQLEVDYDRLVDNTPLAVKEIANFVGVPLNEVAVNFVDPSLRHYVS